MATYRERLKAHIAKMEAQEQQAAPQQQSPTRGQDRRPTEPPGTPRTQVSSGFDPSMLPDMDQRGSNVELSAGATPPQAPATQPQSPTGRQPSGRPYSPLQANPPTGTRPDADIGEIISSIFEFTDLALGPASLLGQVNDAGETIAEKGADSPIMSAFGSALDFGSVGTFDSIAAFTHAMQEAAKGKDFSTAYADRQDAINYGLAENREENPVSTVLGGIGGGVLTSFIPGKLASNIFRGGNWLVRSLLVAPTAAATEAAVYRYNSDGTREEILRDAGFAAAGGALFSGLLGAGGGLIRRLGGRNTTGYEKLAAQELLDAVNMADLSRGGAGGLTAQQLADAMKQKGAKAVLLDVYPELGAFVEAAVKRGDDNVKGKKMLIDLLRHRNMNESTFSEAVADAVKVPRSRSLREFQLFNRQVQDRLRPRYDAIFDAAENRGITLNSPAILDRFRKTADAALDGDGKPMREAQSLLSKALKRAARRDSQGRFTRRVSVRDVHNIKREFDKAIGAAKKANKPLTGLMTARNILIDTLSEGNPEYQRLARTYKSAIDRNMAFEDGYKMFTAKATDADVIESYIARASSYGEIKAFVMGARRKMLEEIRDKTPKQVQTYLAENKRRVDNLAALVGREKADEVVRSVLVEKSKEQARQAVSRTLTPTGPSLKPDKNSAREGVTDLLVATRTGGTSGNAPPAAIRAGGKLLGIGGPSKAQRNAMAEIYGMAMTRNFEEMPLLWGELSKIAKSGQVKPFAGRAAMTGGGVAGGFGTSMTGGTDDVSEAQEAMDSLRNWGSGAIPQ